MACHAIYILDLKGKVIISRNYRGDLPSNVAHRFISKILEEDDVLVKPVVQDEELSYIYVKFNNLYSKYLQLGVQFCWQLFQSWL